ncbi:CapA family protein [Gelidibacter pelagius]|uniref:CapA family protein n=1 Tax=Gelidibacter pelagius TaxID=2819985 RepID=A0ABS3SZK3_9FLAO|nr:CapA family protein [Gelidibacter pelagius]MBO3100177.1 CapA family protein [Gelidibacter pelagius]
MKIFITGDFCPINRADISNSSSKEILDEDFKKLINEADYCITNLECPLTTYNTPISKTGPALKANPENIRFLKKNGFNLVTLANNHIMDFGSKGLKDTIDHLKSNKIDYLGAGKTDNNISTIFKTQNDITVAIINVCENEWSTEERDGYSAYGFSEISMFYAIKKAKQKADKIIIIHHGGHEMYNLPSPRLKATFRFFVDCGANAVINHHTHCISGDEVYRGVPIFYSLGNFIFDYLNHRNSIWNYGMAVTLNFTKEKITFEKHYFEQFNHDPKVRLINEGDLPHNIQELNSLIANDKKLEKCFEIFVKKQERLFNSFIEPVKSKYILALINRGIIPSVWHHRKKKLLSNLIHCESHQEVLKRILKRL